MLGLDGDELDPTREAAWDGDLDDYKRKERERVLELARWSTPSEHEQLADWTRQG